MNDLEIRTLDTFKRVRNFDVTHDGLFPPDTLARDLFDVIAGAAKDIEGFAAAETSGGTTARQGTANKAAAREAILEDLRIIRRTARTMTGDSPGVSDKFRVPRKANDQELLNTARAFLADAEPLKGEFLRRELQERVFQDLAANLAAFEAALNAQYAGRGESVTAAGSMDAAFENGLNALRQLDPIVRNKLHNNHAALAGWESAKRIERGPRRTKPDTTEPPPDSKP
ncbi:MAG TPA: hypothetical protein VF659_13760 [Pyrinomonadaceae bacterium]|jgi:hypothetical protein